MLGTSSLQFRLTAIALLVVLAPLVIFLIISIKSATSTLTEMVTKELVSKSEIVVRNINNFITERVIDTRVISGAEVLQAEQTSRVIRHLSDIVTHSLWINDIDVIDATGKIIASSGVQNEQGKVLWELFPGTEELFYITKNASRGDVVVSEAQLLDSGPGLLFLAPIIDATNNELTRVLAIEVNLKSIQRIVAIFDEGVIGDKFVYIVDNDGNVLITEDPSVQAFDEFPDLAIEPQLLSRFSEQGLVGSLSYTDHTGDRVIAAYADMGEFGITDSLDWSIMAVAPLDEILAPVRSTERILMVTGAFMLCVTTVLALWQARKIAIPLRQAATQAKRISEGDYSQMLEITDLGEIGLFARAFNHMAQTRKNVEEALLASKLLLHNVVDGFGPSSFVGLLTPQGHILLANEPALSAAGLHLEDVLNMPVADSYWFSYSPSAQQKIRDAVKLAAEGEASRFDILIRGPGENTFFWIDITFQPVFDSTGKITYIVPSALVIQERKLAEEKLRLSEKNLAITLNSIGDGVIATDPQGQITRMNPTAERLTGWLLNEAVNHPLSEVFNIISAETRLPAINPVHLVMEHGKVVGLANHTTLLTRDGREYQIADSAAPIRDATGAIVGVVLVFSDVTEEYQAKAELQSSAELFRNTFSMMPAALSLQNPEGILLYCSDEFCQATGYSREEIIGHNAFELNLWVDPVRRVTMQQLLRRDGVVDGLEFQLNRRDGNSTTMLMSARSITIGGKPLILTFAYDITIRKKAEVTLKNAEILAQKMLTKVQETNAELSFQKFALDAHAIVRIADINGNMTYVNDKFCEISGYSQKELIGQNYHQVNSNKQPPEFFQKIWETISCGQTWHGEMENTKKNGGQYWVASTIVPWLDDTGEPISYIAIDTDITKIKNTEILLRRSQKMDSIGELAGGLAHDFNNLLGIIIGNLDLINRQLESGSKFQKQIKKAQDAALRGASLTRRLLNFSRKSTDDNNQVDIGKAVCDFEDLIKKSLTASINIEIILSEELWVVEISLDDFENALINLSLNARDAMPKGGSLTIEVKNSILDSTYTEFKDGIEPGEYVEVSISDNGTGMRKEIIDSIFDPFFTTKDKGRGTGLGLAMVYSFVQRSHGYISVYSETGMGTTFKLYFPRLTSSVNSSNIPTKNSHPLTKGTETILVVDDEAELAAIAKSILETLGYKVILSYSGQAALKELENDSTIDLVFSDVVMHGKINGLDLADIIFQQYPRVKILLTSGFTGKVNRSPRTETLINRMLRKPYRSIDLAERIRETLDERDL